MDKRKEMINIFENELQSFLNYFLLGDVEKRATFILDYLKSNQKNVIPSLLRHAKMIMEAPLERSQGGKNFETDSEALNDALEDAVKLLIISLDYFHFVGHINLNFLPVDIQRKQDDGPFTIVNMSKEDFEKIKKEYSKKVKRNRKI